MTRTTDPAGVATQLGYDVAGRAGAPDRRPRPHHASCYDRSRPAGRGRGPRRRPAASLRTRRLRLRRGRQPDLVTDPLNRVTTYAYDALDRLVRQVEPVTATKSITTTFGYDAAGNRTRYTDGRGNAHDLHRTTASACRSR